jgi:hypothetical protein
MGAAGLMDYFVVAAVAALLGALAVNLLALRYG